MSNLKKQLSSLSKKVAQCTFRERVWILILGVVIIWVMLQVIYLNPILEDNYQLKNKIDNLQLKNKQFAQDSLELEVALKTKQKKLKQVQQQYQQQVAQRQQQYAMLQKQMVNVKQVVVLLQKMLKSSNEIKINTIENQHPAQLLALENQHVNYPNYYQHQLNIDLLGSYPQIIDYLKKLEKAKFIIDELSMQTINHEYKVSLKVSFYSDNQQLMVF